jgi:hypothetical protein
VYVGFTEDWLGVDSAIRDEYLGHAEIAMWLIASQHFGSNVSSYRSTPTLPVCASRHDA